MRGVDVTPKLEGEQVDSLDIADEVVIEIKASGMCGSDLHQYRGPKKEKLNTYYQILRNNLV